MSLRTFVCSSSVVLLAWLAVAFFSEGPQPRHAVPRAQDEVAAGLMEAPLPVDELESEDLAVSVSR